MSDPGQMGPPALLSPPPALRPSGSEARSPWPWPLPLASVAAWPEPEGLDRGSTDRGASGHGLAEAGGDHAGIAALRCGRFQIHVRVR